MFSGKTVVIGITGGIAAYKMPNLVSMLVKQNANVRVIMTEAAEKIVSPIPMESLSKNKCLIDTFDRNFTMETEHIAVADAADVLLIAPATANTIAKLACGIADNMLTTTALACKCTCLQLQGGSGGPGEGGNPVLRKGPSPRCLPPSTKILSQVHQFMRY